MADYGLLTDGFVPKTLTVIREEIQAAVRAVYGASFNVGDKSIAGHFIGILAEALALVWEMGETSNSAQDPDKATGVALDAIAALTGTFREPASFSTAVLVLTGDDGTVVPENSQARTASTQVVFETQDEATIVILDAWVTATAYAVGDRVRNEGVPERAYECITPGTSGVASLSTTDADITDGTVHWFYLGDGEGAVDVDAAATITGPVTASAGDIIQIVSAVSGWDGVTNVFDANPGSDQMTDSELREAREDELAGPGTSPADAILADLEKLDGVTAVRIFVNDTDSTDADGMPPHSVEALVQGGEDQDIFDQLFASVAAGIATTGTEEGTVTDSQGYDHVVKFSRPVEKAIYVEITLVENTATYDGDAAVKAAIAAIGDGEVVGLDAVASRISAAAFVTGVLDVTEVLLDDSPTPLTSVTVAVGSRELATYDTINITVNSSDGTP